MPILTYAAPLLLFAPATLAMVVGGVWTWFLPVFVFAVLPVLDQIHPGSTANKSESEAEAALANPVYDLLIWAVLPLHLGLLATFLWRMSVGGFAPWELAGAVVTMGIACGVYGINVGHELGHRRRGFEQTMSKVLLATSLYAHFFIEHNRGHHRRVATPEDPASAARGETVYGFWVRSMVHSWRSAWELETSRLARLGLPWWSWKSEMVRLTAAQGALVVAIGVLAGPLALGAFMCAALFGALLLETVNYLEHYGLRRARTAHGVYERVQPHHSWNSNRPMGRVFLHDLTRHADHHAHPTRPYQVLRHFEDAPQLPAGYPAMVMAALVPPLFDRWMEPELMRWQAAHGEQAAA